MPEAWAATVEVVDGILKDALPPLCDDVCRAFGRILSAETSRDLELLPALTCRSLGGDEQRAIPACASWVLVRLAAKLLDDVQDGDVDLSRRIPLALEINGAVALVYLSQLGLARLSDSIAIESRLCASRKLNEACLLACSGHHRDLRAAASPVSIDPDAWQELARRKSGALYGWAAWVGALLAGANANQCAAYHEYGAQLGVLIQIGNDYDGIWSPRGRSDLAVGSPNLAVAYTRLSLGGRARTALDALLVAAQQGDDAAERRAVEIVTEAGAPTYLLVIASLVRGRAREALSRLGGSATTDYLERALARVWRFDEEQEGTSCT